MPELKNLKVSEAMHKQLRLTAIHNNQTLQEVVAMILNAYYETRKELK